MNRIALSAAVATLAAVPLVAPPAEAGPLCSTLGVCGKLKLTAGSVSWVTVECGGDVYSSARVYPGWTSPGLCDANGFTVNKSGYKMYRRVVGHDGFVTWVRLVAGRRYGISDGSTWVVRKVKA